jgi:hypothetical protein
MGCRKLKLKSPSDTKNMIPYSVQYISVLCLDWFRSIGIFRLPKSKIGCWESPLTKVTWVSDGFSNPGFLISSVNIFEAAWASGHHFGITGVWKLNRNGENAKSAARRRGGSAAVKQLIAWPQLSIGDQ